MRRTLRLLTLVVVLAIAATVGTAPAAGATPTVICNSNSSGLTNTAYCHVRSGSWVSYQAYLTARVGPMTDPWQSTIRVRVQILARQGSTSTIIAGMWLVCMGAPRTALSPAVEPVDGNSVLKHGSWNYFGRYSPDAAVCPSNTNITRYPGLSITHPIGLAWGRNPNPVLYFRYQLWNGNHQDTLYTTQQVNMIIFYRT